jgi:hypothetical protein
MVLRTNMICKVDILHFIMSKSEIIDEEIIFTLRNWSLKD